MEQQVNKQIIRYKNSARRYKKQRDAVIIVALIIIFALTVVYQAIFDKQADNFEQLEEIVQSYHERCDSQQRQICRSYRAHPKFEDESSTMQDESSTMQDESSTMQDETDETRLYFVPDTWELETAQAAKIYQSIPLDKDLQEYVWDLCVYLEIPECYETILAIMWQETHFDASLVSATNDYGLMQINEINIYALCDTLGITDIMAVDQNICSGVYLFAINYKQFGNINEALMAYNMGPAATYDCLANGTYSTDYSRSVISKTEMILQDKYDPST